MVNGGKPDEDVIIVFWIDSHHLESLYWFELFLFIYSVMFDFSFEAATDPYMRFIHLKGASISPHLHLKLYFLANFCPKSYKQSLESKALPIFEPEYCPNPAVLSHRGHFKVERGHFFSILYEYLSFELKKIIVS